MKRIRIAILAAAAAAALPAMAQPRPMGYYAPFYFGAGAGQGNLNRDAGDLTGLSNGILDDTSTTYTVRGGWRFNPFMALELSYYDLGKYTFSGTLPGSNVRLNGEAKAKAFGASFVAMAPLGRGAELYGRIGVVSSEMKANVSTNTPLPGFDGKDQETGATYGVGGRWQFGPHWSFFAEWMKNDKLKVDSYLAGIDFRF